MSQMPDDGQLEQANTYAQLCNAFYKTDILEQSFAFGYENLCSDTSKIERGEDQSLFRIESSGLLPIGLRQARGYGKLYEFEWSGVNYWVSANPNRRGRTMQFLALTHGIFALRQKASKPPAVTAFTNLR